MWPVEIFTFDIFKIFIFYYLPNISLQASFFFILYFTFLETNVKLNLKMRSGFKQTSLQDLSPQRCQNEHSGHSSFFPIIFPGLENHLKPLHSGEQFQF